MVNLERKAPLPALDPGGVWSELKFSDHRLKRLTIFGDFQARALCLSPFGHHA